MMTLKLHPEVEKFLQNHAGIIELLTEADEPQEKWYHMPYWIKKVDDHYLMVPFEELPENFKQFVMELRDGKTK